MHTVCMSVNVRVLRTRTHNPLNIFSRMEWLPLVSSLKLQVSFAEYRLFYRALMQKDL